MVDPQALAEDSLIEEDFLIELKANGMADNTLTNYQQAIETLGELEKEPRDLKKKDLITWSADTLEGYAESTTHIYKAYVKRYLKWLKTGDLNGGEYPDCVKWIKTGRKNQDLPKEILSHEEIKELAQITDNQRDRTMIWVGYESGARPGELLDMKIKDVEFDEYGAKIMVDGKTGERRIRLVESVPDLKNWLSMHPEGDDPGASLWPSRRSDSLSYPAFWKNLKKYAEKSEVEKNVHPHLLRHSRATHLAAQGMNESQMREIFGWSKDSRMPSIYVHLSGRDTDSAVLGMYGIEVDESENQLEMGVRECSFCGHENSPNAKFCEECNGPLDSQAAKRADSKERKEDGHVQEFLKFLREEHPETLLDFYEKKENVEELRELSGSEAEG